MVFHLRVYDNFHYTDETEADDIGSYDAYEDAEIEAKAIVDKFLKSNWKKGINPADLLCLFDEFGNDPAIISDVHVKHEHFSARNYANSRLEEVYNKNGNK
jgi:hypothetical protein